ncbi:MAG: hypothetical protein RLZZ628_3089 [Bacteroidota bacterium]|jgi:hypothetical protein
MIARFVKVCAKIASELIFTALNIQLKYTLIVVLFGLNEMLKDTFLTKNY